MMKPIEKNSELSKAEALARTCWDRLFLHARSGNCGCHLDVGGSVHVIHGCMPGRTLNDDYVHACELVRELTDLTEKYQAAHSELRRAVTDLSHCRSVANGLRSALEAGDFDKPLVSSEVQP